MTHSEQIHGHEVMRMMVDSGRSFTKESLRDAIVDRFGSSARFHTCSAENLTADELIEFLAARGKFIEAGTGFSTDANRICQH